MLFLFKSNDSLRSTHQSLFIDPFVSKEVGKNNLPLNIRSCHHFAYSKMFCSLILKQIVYVSRIISTVHIFFWCIAWHIFFFLSTKRLLVLLYFVSFYLGCCISIASCHVLLYSSVCKYMFGTPLQGGDIPQEVYPLIKI